MRKKIFRSKFSGAKIALFTSALAVFLVGLGFIFNSPFLSFLNASENGKLAAKSELIDNNIVHTSNVFNLAETEAIFNGNAFSVPESVTEDVNVEKNAKIAGTISLNQKAVLGVSTTEAIDNKRIEVDLTNQKLYAYEGKTRVFEFLVSTGLWGRTPTGVFRIWSKWRFTRMSGGSKALRTYYDLPNVPYTMFFANSDVPAARGFGIHGTYWHSNFGHPMSHGCINMKTEEVALLYEWADPQTGSNKSMRASKENPGTQVIIYGTAPAK